MEKLLEGKVAIVTGSGQGIGRELAIAFADQGAKVITNNRRKSDEDAKLITAEIISTLNPKYRAVFKRRAEEMIGDAGTTASAIIERGGIAFPFYGDASDYDVAEKLIETAVREFGSVDIVANVSGTFGYGEVTDVTEEKWNRVTGTKPKGYFNTIHFAAKYMKKNGWGRIINCTSRAFLGDKIPHCEYSAANAGVVGLTRALAIELRPYGITCNAFEPFAQTRASIDADPTPKSSEYAPRRAVPFLTYLATDAAKDITGSVFSIAGNTIGIYSEPEIKKSVTKYSADAWTVDELMRDLPKMLFRDYRSIADL